MIMSPVKRGKTERFVSYSGENKTTLVCSLEGLLILDQQGSHRRKLVVVMTTAAAVAVSAASRSEKNVHI